MKRSRYTVLISGMLIQLCAGIIYMWSVFRGPVSQHLNWDSGAAAYTSSIMLASFVLGILICGRLQDRIGPKKVTMLGSCFIGAGMLLTALVPQSAPWLLYLTYGILGGFGVGSVYTCTVAVVQKWFPDKRGFATGLIVGAFGFSLVVFSPLAKFLLGKIGVPMTFVLFAAAFLLICIPCSMFIDTPEESDLPAMKKAGAVSTRVSYTPVQMLKTPQFLLLFFSMLFLLSTYFIVNPQIISLAEERGIDENLAVFTVMLTGLASASGRLLLSWISDKIGRKAALMIICFITLISAPMLIFAKGALFIAVIILIAFAFGGSSGVYAAVTADNFGTAHAGANFGCVMVAFGCSALLSPLVAGRMSVSAGFILSACCAAAALICILIYKPIAAKTEK